MSLHVLDPGALSLFQDLGRPGLADAGVGPSGAFDRAAARMANALVGNDESAAVIENLGGLTLEARGPHLVAVAGAAGPLSINGDPVDSGRPLALADRDVLTVGAPTLGLRWTIAVSGGFTIEPVLGSRSRDTLAALGPDPLERHDLLGVGTPRPVSTEKFTMRLRPAEHAVRVVLGPRDDWFTPAGVQTFLTSPWTVDPVSDRVGVRLNGAALERHTSAELASEPIVRGSIQVTSAGLPVVLGPDHPVTGGYPVIAVVIDADLDQFAHMRPGDIVRFSRAHSRQYRPAAQQPTAPAAPSTDQ